MQGFKTLIRIVFLMLCLNVLQAQQSKPLFYATMKSVHATELKTQHPEDIYILTSANGYSAVRLTEEAAHQLHRKVLVHGPGFIYEPREKSAIDAISNVKMKTKRAAAFSITQEALVRQSLDLVDNINIANQIQELEDYGTRYHTTTSARNAVLDLRDKWVALAAGRSDVSVRIVNHTSTSMPSVVMTITGTEAPEDFVIIGGHIDSTARNNNNNAPGADDNASGIATITEAARVLFEMDFKPKRTMEFMAFAAEEVGLRGSREIAEDYSNRNVNVVSYLQLDMTNYKGSPNDIYISTDSYNDDSLNDFLISLLNFYNASGTHQLTYGTSSCNYGCSDHYSWAQEGFDVAFPFEASFSQSNPNIHTPNDTFDRSPTPNATHAAKFAKLALEYLIEIGNGVQTGGGGDGECTSSVNTFPYSQGFESNLGSWTQSNQDDLDWTIDSNGTPSSGTGPSAATEGSSYLYVEASGNGTGYPSKKAIITSPCFDLSSQSDAELSFDYHMNGNAIGSLSVELSLDNGGSWTSIFSKSGSQGTDWITASVDLSAYAADAVQLRLITITGNSWQGDIAIDDLKIGTTTGNTDICEGVSPYSSSVSYQPGDQVTYQGNLYERTNTGWQFIGACGTTSRLAPQSLLTDAVEIMQIFPNPTSGNQITLKASADLWQQGSVLITDTKGSILKEIKLSQETTEISVGDLSQGIYYISLINNQDRYTKRFVKK